MQVNEIIMYIMAVGVLLGGIDLIFGNRFGYGDRFQEAFRLMGSIGLSMAGIICLAPLLSQLLSACVTTLCNLINIDPGVFGSILAIDMGGYQLSMDLATNPVIGKFSGIVVSAIFGCTVVFTFPVGLGIMEEQDRIWFTHGILLGFITMPAAFLVGGTLSGMTIGEIIRNFCPIMILSALLVFGLFKFRSRMIRFFQYLAKGIHILATVGLMLGAVRYMTGIEILRQLTPLDEAIQVVGAISVVMLGSLPLAEVLNRTLRKPFGWIGERTGMNAASMTGILIGVVSVVPALVMIPQMDRRGKIVNGAFLVCAASTFAAHLGFTAGVQPDMVAALLASKLVGGVLAILIALIFTSRQEMHDSNLPL